MEFEYNRTVDLTDLSVRSEGDGRTVDAYAAIFNTPAPVNDRDGQYDEIIDPGAFNRDIAIKRRTSGGYNIPVLFNHGMTLFHTPSDRYSNPIGTTLEIKADKKGLFTRSRFHNTESADEVLESIRSGAITAYSFAGVFRESSPGVPRGGFRARSDGGLPTVIRKVSTIREFGPATFPVYAGAEVVGVRAEQAAAILSRLLPGEVDRLTDMLTSSTRSSLDVDQLEDGTSDEELELATEDQPEGHSVRSPKEQLMANYAAFIIRTRSPK